MQVTINQLTATVARQQKDIFARFKGQDLKIQKVSGQSAIKQIGAADSVSIDP